MIQHFAGPVLAIMISLWGAVVAQYHSWGFHTVPVTPREVPHIVVESPGATSSFPTPFEHFVDRLSVATSSTAPSSTPTAPKPAVPKGPVAPTEPSIPFTPIPVPTPPPITPTSPQNPTPVPAATTTSPIVTPPEVKETREEYLKARVVNIICLPGGGLPGSSGTGVVIDPRGLVLTVAHVGQGFLLRDYPTKGSGTCYIRTGSPAKNAYSADLVYISPSWIHENKATFLEKMPTGTGENDFAILAITGTLTSTPVPSSLPYIPLVPTKTRVRVGDEVGTGSYAAEFLTSSQIRSALYPTIKFAKVDDLFTFGHTTVDLFSVAAGSAAQEGSSGGAVINGDKFLIGVISTRTAKADLSLRSLQALTMDHVRRSFTDDMGVDLDAYLKGRPATLIAAFRPTAADLLEELKSDMR